MRVRSRPGELRPRALIERGVTYFGEGKRALARKHFEKVLGENSTYPVRANTSPTFRNEHSLATLNTSVAPGIKEFDQGSL